MREASGTSLVWLAVARPRRCASTRRTLKRGTSTPTLVQISTGHPASPSVLHRSRGFLAHTISRPPALTAHSSALAGRSGGDRKRSTLSKGEQPAALEEVALSASADVLHSVSAFAQSPLRPGVLDDIHDVASVAALRKQVRARAQIFRYHVSRA